MIAGVIWNNGSAIDAGAYPGGVELPATVAATFVIHLVALVGAAGLGALGSRRALGEAK